MSWRTRLSGAVILSRTTTGEEKEEEEGHAEIVRGTEAKPSSQFLAAIG
jgi:hypothetical protein